MWRRVLFFLLMVHLREAMILFEDPVPANETSEGFAYTDPKKDLVNQLLERAMTDFALRLESQITTTPDSPNVVFSPLSITSVLAFVLLGAQGQTEAEVERALGFTAGIELAGRSSTIHEEFGRLIGTLQKQKVIYKGTRPFSIARGLFLQQGLDVNPYFINQTMAIYNIEIQRIDFEHNPREALVTINNWVEKHTQGRIKDLLQQEPETSTKAIIASALYYNGQWENPFYQGATKQKPFFVGKQAGSSSNEIVNVDLMVNGAEIPYYADEERKCTIIGMPYKGGKKTMYVIVPDEEVKTFLDNTGSNDIVEMIRSMKKTSVIFFLPRMKLESSINLVPPLRNMGIHTLFDSNRANLSNIAEGVYVNEAIHKVEVDINEVGTVAAAATAFTFTRDGSSPVVRVDKPFIFFIRHDESGIILFWGTVIKPNPHYPYPTPHE